jgi:hypothetical protein
MSANLYLVFVEVRYTKPGFDSAERFWPVRIVAMNADAAEAGALEWAQRQKDPTMIDGVAAFARQTLHTECIAKVDCIGASVISASG